MTVDENARRSVANLIDVLDLAKTEARTTEDIFTGVSHPMPTGRVYGGQVLAQSLIAAARTLPEDRVVHSMHGYFLRPGDASQGITFAVDRIHDGRSFSTRRSQAYQGGVPIFSMISSFQDEDPGLEHAEPIPDGLPDPESLPSDDELIGTVHPVTGRLLAERPADIRHITGPLFVEVAGERVPRQAVWMRMRAPLPDSPRLHR